MALKMERLFGECLRILCNLVRALTNPYIGAHFTKNGEEIKVWKVEVLKDEKNQNIEPGKVLTSRSSKTVVKCGQGSIILLEIKISVSLLKEIIYEKHFSYRTTSR